MRLWMHFPIGGISALAYMKDPLLGLSILASTFVYEVMNDWRKEDQSYKDVLGIVWGFGIVSVIGLLM